MDELTYNQLLAVCITYVANQVPPLETFLLDSRQRLLTASFVDRNFPDSINKFTHAEFLEYLMKLVEAKVKTDQVLSEFTKGKPL